jgi:hypothetical protein
MPSSAMGSLGFKGVFFAVLVVRRGVKLLKSAKNPAVKSCR